MLMTKQGRPAANFDAPEKLLVRQTGDEIIAALDINQYLCLNNLHVLVPKKECKHLNGILALLNSKLITWCFRAMNPEAGEALAEVKKEFVEDLPIPSADKLVGLAKLSENLMSLKKGHPTELSNRQERALLKQIEELSCQAFGVNSEEYKIIEAMV
jgi:hypothetical protein